LRSTQSSLGFGSDQFERAPNGFERAREPLRNSVFKQSGPKNYD
jgi:hypothetical protein